MSYEVLTQMACLMSCASRLRVLECVGELGMYAGDIARSVDLSLSTTSYHLAVLEKAGLVRHTRQGRYRWYESTGVRWGVVREG